MREVRLGLPIELKPSEQVALLRAFTHREFVAKGMVADMAIHRDNPTPTQLGTLDTAPMNDIDAKQQAAAERWAARQHSPTPGQGAQPGNDHSLTPSRSHKMERDLELRRDGPEEDLEL